MQTQGIISHRMFVAALSQDEKVKGAMPAKNKVKAKKNATPRTELTPHQLMLSILKEQLQGPES